MRGIISCFKPTTFSDCCILENTETRLFYATGQIRLINCILPDTFTITSNINTNNEEISSFVDNIKLTEKGYCPTDIQSLTSTHFLSFVSIHRFSHFRNIILPPGGNYKSEVEIVKRVEFVRKGSMPKNNTPSAYSVSNEHYDMSFLSGRLVYFCTFSLTIIIFCVHSLNSKESYRI